MNFLRRLAGRARKVATRIGGSFGQIPLQRLHADEGRPGRVAHPLRRLGKFFARVVSLQRFFQLGPIVGQCLHRFLGLARLRGGDVLAQRLDHLLDHARLVHGGVLPSRQAFPGELVFLGGLLARGVVDAFLLP